MLGAILKATNSSFQKGMIFCGGIYVKKVMKLLAFIFEQPSYSFYQTTASLCLFLPHIYVMPHCYIQGSSGSSPCTSVMYPGSCM